MGFVPLQSTRASPPSARSFSDAAPSRRSRAVPEPCGPASPGVLAPTNTFTSGAPSPPRTSFRSPVGDGSRQTPVGAVLRVLAPLDGSGQHAARSRSCDPAVRRGPRRFAAFFHAARVPGTSLQSFPFPGIRTRSRGPILPCGSVFDCRRRRACETFAVAFAASRQLFARGAHPEAGPGRMSRDDGSLRSLVRSPRPAR